MRIGHLDLVGPGVGGAGLVDSHRQRVRVILAGHRVDTELESVAGLQRLVLAEPLRRRLGRRLDLTAEHDGLAVLPQ